jgi:hypothetical protein
MARWGRELVGRRAAAPSRSSRRGPLSWIEAGGHPRWPSCSSASRRGEEPSGSGAPGEAAEGAEGGGGRRLCRRRSRGRRGKETVLPTIHADGTAAPGSPMTGGSRLGAAHRSWERAESGPPWLELELTDQIAGGGAEVAQGDRRHGPPCSLSFATAHRSGRRSATERTEETTTAARSSANPSLFISYRRGVRGTRRRPSWKWEARWRW